MTNKYLAVIFDVGGVLISPPQVAIGLYEKKIKVPKGFISRVFVQGEPDNAFCRLECGEITLSQFVPEFEKECYEYSLRRNEEFNEGFSAGELFQFIGSLSKPDPRMFAVVKMLRQLGYKVCALTNNWTDGKTDFNSVLGGHFDVVIESCKVGVRKPDPSIYALACEKLKVEPSQVVFLDDLGRNLKVARQLGIETILVKGTSDAIKQLEHTLNIALTPQSKL